ncbi:MAG: KOW motif-containing protein [Deltaproteobacteria bacterium]|jgi:ribosomal protein L24|nr:KOW motif-containing protein [Deltaproteobacteria bacterium]
MALNSRAARLKSKREAVLGKRVPCPYREGDVVFILSGHDRGKTGPFQRYDRKKNLVFIEGRKLIERYVKARPDIQREAGRYKLETGVHVSSTAWYCHECSRPSALRRRVTKAPEDPSARADVTWVCRRCGAERPSPKRK